MTLGRTIGTAVMIAVLSLGIAWLGSELFYVHWLRSIVAHGGRAQPEISAETFDHDIRTALPAGSSRIAVESALRSRHMDYHFSNAHEIEATASDLKGSDPVAQAAVAFTFHFDDHDALTSIDSLVSNTGP